MDTPQVVVEIVSECNGNNGIMEETVNPPQIEQQSMERSGNNKIVEETKVEIVSEPSDETLEATNEEIVSERSGNNEIVEETTEIVPERSGNNEIMEETVNPPQIEQQVESDIEKGARANAFSEKIMRKLDQAPRKYRENHIFRVEDAIRKGHEHHYEPTSFAIGPYHRDKSNLQPTEEYKWMCLNANIEMVAKIASISTSDVIKRCYEVLEGLEDEARGYYTNGTPDLDSGAFLEMLLLDGFFLLDFLGNTFVGIISFMYAPQKRSSFHHDVLLLENQLPFFILEKLADVIKKTTTCHHIRQCHGKAARGQLLLHVTYSVFNIVTKCIRHPTRALKDYWSALISVYKLYGDDESADQIRELIEISSITDIAVVGNGREIDPEKLKNNKHLLEVVYKLLLEEDLLEKQPKKEIPVVSQDLLSLVVNMAYETRYNTYSVTELSNAGVKFKSVDKQKFYDIQFKNGTLEIPHIRITRNATEGLLRNLMSYEVGVCRIGIINDYVSFMDSLINSGKDVELLRIHGIIEHYLGDDEAVSTMFNSIGAISELFPEYYYSKTVKQLKHHCEKKKNVWMAKLRSDYFGSPWTIISVIAAFVLLVLTIIQTVYSPLSYYNG